MVKRDMLQNLIKKAESHSVSIYLPTHRENAAAQQDPIRYKNLLNKAEKELIEMGMRQPEVDEMLKEPYGLINSESFWLHQSDGLAMFITPDHYEYYRLPLEFEEFVYVNDHFLITPMLPMLARDGSYHVLALSQNNVRFYTCNSDSIEQIELDIPESMEEFQQYDVYEKHLQAGPAPGGGRVLHGQGDYAEDDKKFILDFLKHVENGVTDYMNKQQTPLVLAGVKEITSMYRRVNHYHQLVDETIAGNTDKKSDKELREESWRVMEPKFLEEIEEELERYGNLKSSKLVSSDLEEVVKAARYGKVDTLFVPKGQHRWGEFDEDKQTVLLTNERTNGNHDLFNVAATETLTKKGNVYALDGNRMPEHSSIAAIMRFE